ncbi:MAG: hypothetical protein ACYC35_24240 [Pirellulales bacterium]
MEVAGAVIAIITLALLIGFFINSAFLLWGASLAGIENRTFGKAMGTTLLGGIASLILSLMCSVVPVIGTVLGFIGGFFIMALMMTAIFSTTYGKALAAVVIAWVLSLIVVGGLILLGLLVGGGLAILGQSPASSLMREKPAANALPEQPTRAQAPSAKAPPAKPEPPTLTMAGYLAVTPGMSYAEAAKHLGSQGQETSRMRLDVIPGLMDASEVVSYVWTSPNGARVEAAFQNDKLMTKVQTGLR